MALQKCHECGKDISDEAKSCPSCGAKVKKVKKPVGPLGIAFCGLLLAAFIWAGTESAANRDLAVPAAPSQVAATPVVSTVGSWVYHNQADELTSKSVRQAVIDSQNLVEFKFPYNGAQRGTLIVRHHPRHGKDIILSISKGQFLCRSYADCKVKVVFDDGKVESFSGGESSDNDTTVVFIKNYDRFYAKLKKAKRVRVSTEVYQEGAPVFDFNVAGFDEAKYVK